MSKRLWGENFSQADKETLIFLITSTYRSVLENKKTDEVSNKEKAAAWARLSEEFNAVGGAQRSALQLKKLWQNMKMSTRKNAAEAKISLFKTGKPKIGIFTPSSLLSR